MQRILLIILAALIVAPSFGQRRKKGDEEAGPVFVEGITYSLPRTGIRIYVKATKETYEPGPYAMYAEQLLGIENARRQGSVQWNIEDVKLETFSEPDPTQVYKALGEGAFTVSLTPEGCLAGINTSADFSLETSVKTNRFLDKTEKENDFSFSNFNDTPLYTPGDSTNNFRPVRVSDEKKASEAAARILETRLTRFHMVAGLMDEFHPDGVAYKVSLEELDKIEKNYMSLFTGHTTYQTETFSFDFIPSAASGGRGEVVFRFSEDNGVVPASDLSGKPVTVRVNPVEGLKSKYTTLAASENPAAGESGVFYRMPGMANLEIIFEVKTIASARVLLPQLGETAPVPEELLYGEYSIEIHPQTGAIKSVVKTIRK
jgi:hypothetical protein